MHTVIPATKRDKIFNLNRLELPQMTIPEIQDYFECSHRSATMIHHAVMADYDALTRYGLCEYRDT